MDTNDTLKGYELECFRADATALHEFSSAIHSHASRLPLHRLITGLDRVLSTANGMRTLLTDLNGARPIPLRTPDQTTHSKPKPLDGPKPIA